MKRTKRRLPIPQHEFGFAPATFNLMIEIGLDGDRITRERAVADHARRLAEKAQATLFTTQTPPALHDGPFGEPVYRYTRKQAIADGMQVEVTQAAAEAGIRFPVFLTRIVFDAYVTVPPGVEGQDEAGRLWDIVWMLRFAMVKAAPAQARLPFTLHVRNDNRAPCVVKLIATCGPLDLDDPRPAITVMTPDED